MLSRRAGLSAIAGLSCFICEEEVYDRLEQLLQHQSRALQMSETVCVSHMLCTSRLFLKHFSCRCLWMKQMTDRWVPVTHCSVTLCDLSSWVDWSSAPEPAQHCRRCEYFVVCHSLVVCWLCRWLQTFWPVYQCFFVYSICLETSIKWCVTYFCSCC